MGPHPPPPPPRRFQILIGGVECVETQWLNHTRALCRVGPGVGQDLPVLLTVAGQRSAPAVNVSRAPPSVASLILANAVRALVQPPYRRVITCALSQSVPTMGGAVITVVGDNFGGQDDGGCCRAALQHWLVLRSPRAPCCPPARAGAIVFVAAEPCERTLWVSPQRLVCVLAPGVGVSRPHFHAIVGI
jgi:hypothetical protein